VTRRELRIALQIALIVGYLLLLYVGDSVLKETFTVFDYGRF
jgi:hypothetical protein